MPCETCNAAVTIKDSTGGSKGEFTETHECANGRTGTVQGESGTLPETWRRSGAVFEDYGV